MKKILFLKQSSIMGTCKNIELSIEAALKAHPSIQVSTFDIVSGIRELKTAHKNQKNILDDYVQHIIKTISDQDPTYILFLNGYAITNLFPSLFDTLKKNGILLISWNVDDPYYFDLQYKISHFFDYLFTVEHETVELWKCTIKKSFYLPLAFDSTTIAPLKEFKDSDAYKAEICFIGTPFKNSERVRFIDEHAEYLAGFNTKIIGASSIDTWAHALKKYDTIKHCIIDAPIDSFEALKYYQASIVNLNIHKDSFGHQWDHNSRCLKAHSPNERFYTIGGTGGFQIIDSTRYFDPAEFPHNLIHTFNSSVAFKDIISYYFTHHEQRISQAHELQRIILLNHTYHNRITTLIEQLT